MTPGADKGETIPFVFPERRVQYERYDYSETERKDYFGKCG